VVLLIADRRRGTRETESLPLGHALLIGLSQALALMPGVSRSGVTISAALLLGYRRDEAARFSFLLATPITFGAAALKVPALLEGAQRNLALAGMAAAMLVGWASIVLLLRFVRTHDYRPFVWYRFAFAALVLGTLLMGLL
jgi:undecaprenyl-diphosphatase